MAKKPAHFYSPAQIAVMYQLDVKRVYKAINKLGYSKGRSNYKLSTAQMEAIVAAEKLIATRKKDYKFGGTVKLQDNNPNMVVPSLNTDQWVADFKSNVAASMLAEKLKAEKDRIEFNKLIGTIAIVIGVISLITLLVLLVK